MLYLASDKGFVVEEWDPKQGYTLKVPICKTLGPNDQDLYNADSSKMQASHEELAIFYMSSVIEIVKALHGLRILHGNITPESFTLIPGFSA